jgi:eukaryotic-like serine/threonine-protein kinase
LRTLGPYSLVRRLATGGMADIFLAERDGQPFAVKRILPHLAQHPDVVEMFLGEVELSRVLHDPRIVRIVEAGEDEGAYYLVMELVDGRDLSAILEARPKPVPETLVAAILAEVAGALHHAHERRAVHRDVSPSNVMVSYGGEVKLLDFGIAAAKAGDEGVLKGKYAYMAPEQVKGLPLDRRADLFSLGIVAHELATGQRLFYRENQLATLHAITDEDAPRVEGVSAPMAEVIARLLQRDPDDRFQDAAELEAALRRMITVGEAQVRLALAKFMAHVFPVPVAPPDVPAPIVAAEVPAVAGREINVPFLLTLAVVAAVVIAWLVLI